jgi:hypothetical protein
MQTLNEKLQAEDLDRQVRVETMDELKKPTWGDSSSMPLSMVLPFCLS